MLSTRPAIPLALVALLAAPVSAQNGDQAGEEQPPLPDDLVIPPAPVLPPDEQLPTFALPPGFAIELVAAEPLVVNPVAITFGADGRLWVVEMRGYMPNIEGEGEREPVGAIAVLTDTDGDGRMDARTEFLSELVLPRAVAPTRGGALVIAPPELLFCRDTDGDGRADEREVIATGLAGLDNPEHAINGLLPTLDNWFQVANDRRRWRFSGGEWVEGYTNGGGQWGITQDDVGRVFFNTNPDPLRGDLFPSWYALRNPNHGNASGVNVRIAHDMATWPARINPGVNRGYRSETLRDDFTLAAFTGACGPHVYRGDALGDEVRGDAFVCEPTGNLLKRYELGPKGELGLEATSVHAARDFLTSTDERFRPVNLADGPDGALYVVDFARGLIQHRIYLTTFLRQQIEERGLAGPMGLGRIWRVVREDARREPVTVTEWTWQELVDGLGHANGWVRDVCQRAIVDEWVYDAAVLAMLRSAALDSEEPLGRLHALWTLEGIDWVTGELVARALVDDDPRVLHAAVRLSEPFLATGTAPELVERVAALGRHGDGRLAHQVLLSLGEARLPAADRALADLLSLDAGTSERRSAVLSGVAGRELELLADLLARWSEPAPGRETTLKLLARCVAREGVHERVERLVSAAAVATIDWHARALRQGLLDGRRKDPKGQPSPLRLAREPRAFGTLAAIDDDLARAAADALAWPGKPGLVEEDPVRPLTPEEHARFEAGRATFTSICAACHQTTGLGEPGKAPPLRWQPYVLGSEERLVSILVNGLVGPLEIDGIEWNGDMPAFVASPEEIAAVATYVRREWGHGADPVTPDTVRAVIDRTHDRRGPWTARELDDM